MFDHVHEGIGGIVTELLQIIDTKYTPHQSPYFGGPNSNGWQWYRQKLVHWIGDGSSCTELVMVVAWVVCYVSINMLHAQDILFPVLISLCF